MENKINYEIYYNGYIGDFCYIIVKIETDATGGRMKYEVCREDSLDKALRYVHYNQPPEEFNGFGVKVYEN